MPIKDIKNDAENLVTRKKHIIEIGQKLMISCLVNNIWHH